MKTNLDYLPERKQHELKQLVAALIPRFVEVEMIILFGSYARGNYVERDVFVEKGTNYEYKSDYDLLVVMSKNAYANSDTLMQAMTRRMQELGFRTPVHPIYHGMDFLNHELSEGNYFFNDIREEGILLFTTNRYQLVEKRELSLKEVQAKAQKDFTNWFASADEFMIDYRNALGRESYNKAAFELHQAAERYYVTIQLVFTGYKPKTHDLDVLSRMAKSLDIEFGRVFPQVSPAEIQRFELLRKAYVEARYNMDYVIGEDDLRYLQERVELLRGLTERICEQKIRSFTA